mmetsp:Transcript_16644/g.43035  ORF Transcript_16644/g.43035 Transcript_16644/m.43035 type:complete len:212 (-) Transcript_16644:102-737(-)
MKEPPTSTPVPAKGPATMAVATAPPKAKEKRTTTSHIVRPCGCLRRKAATRPSKSSRVPSFSMTQSASSRCFSPDICVSILLFASSSGNLFRDISRASCTSGGTTTATTPDKTSLNKRGLVTKNLASKGMSKAIWRCPFNMSTTVCLSISCKIGECVALFSALSLLGSPNTISPRLALSILPSAPTISEPNSATNRRPTLPLGSDCNSCEI